MDIDELPAKLKEFGDQRPMLCDKAELPVPSKTVDKKHAMKKDKRRKKNAKNEEEADIKDVSIAVAPIQ